MTNSAATQQLADRDAIDALLRGECLGIDVRAPAEFQRSRAPNSVNLPILTDRERQRIGITYKQQGQAAALRLGHRLVAGAVRDARIDGWRTVANTAAKAGGAALLFCWRGGLRSQLACEWLADAGVSVQRLAGGYRVIRARCLELLEQFPTKHRPVLIGGRTGTGKTVLLKRLRQYIDLEGLAEHRGSAFGEVTAQQPTPASFDNLLAAATLPLNDTRAVFLEDESRTIGRLALPEPWFKAMQAAPIVQLECSLEERAAHLEEEYIRQPLALGQTATELERRYHSALRRIQKRLGGLRYQRLSNALAQGFAEDRHERWIRLLLTQYYDPSYDYQLAQKASRVVFKGSARDIVRFLEGFS